MNGKDLWSIFLGAAVPDNDLITLGEDIGHKREVASAVGQKALLKICVYAASLNGGSILFSPSQAYQALKMWMPGGNNPLTVKDVRKRLLEAIAAEYEVKKPWEHVSGPVREYFVQVGGQLPSLETQAPAPPPSAPPPSPPQAPSTTMGASGGKSFMGADEPVAMTDKGSPRTLTPSQFTWLHGTVQRLKTRPASVSDNHLAAARNYAARANLSHTLGYLEGEIEKRSSGAQTEEASSRAAGEKKPIWPFALGAAALLGWLSYVSRKGQRLIHERVARERGLAGAH